MSHQYPSNPRIGIYLRISSDPDGTQTATQRQQKDCLAWAERNGATVADVFEDVDLSAFKRSTTRPEFERMLAAVRSRDLDGVLAWKIDRIARRMRDFVRLDEACEDAGAFVATIADGIDTRTPMGRTAAELFVSMARMESENISIRQQRKHLEKVERGEPHGGGMRPFGYSAHSPRTIVESEAALIREAADRMLHHGAGLGVIVRDWNARGIPSSSGRGWTHVALRKMLVGRHLNGLRNHNGVTCEVPGWDAILAYKDTTRLRAILLDPSRAQGGKGRYALSGILRCALCGGKLTGCVHGKAGRMVAKYRCAAQPGQPNCGRLSRDATLIERAVRDMIAEAIDSGAFERQRASGHSDESIAATEAIRADEESLEELSNDYYKLRLISRAEFFSTRDSINARLESARRSLVRGTQPDPLALAGSSGAALRGLWDGGTNDTRRALSAAFFESIIVAKSRGRGYRFQVSDLSPVWRV